MHKSHPFLTYLVPAVAERQVVKWHPEDCVILNSVMLLTMFAHVRASKSFEIFDMVLIYNMRHELVTSNSVGIPRHVCLTMIYLYKKQARMCEAGLLPAEDVEDVAQPVASTSSSVLPP